MSHFYGIIKGTRGEATRCGTKNSGLGTTAASWQGAVDVYLYENNGVDFARISLKPWHGRGTSKELYDGPVGGAP